MTTQGKPLSDAVINRVYEDFDPAAEREEEQAYETIFVSLPGFKKENLRVQITSSPKIRVSGERPLASSNHWQRFHKEFPIPSNCDTNNISAKFENGVLHVKLPKAIVPAVGTKENVLKPPTQALKPPTTEAPKPPTKEARKPPPTEAPKPPTKEALKPPTEAPKPQKPISASEPQPQKTNANQEHDKKPNIIGSSQANGSTKSATSHVEGDQGSNVAHKTLEKEKIEDNRGKKVEDSTREEYRGAIFGHANNSGVEKCSYRPQGYNYNQVINGLVMELKQQPRKLVNLCLAFLFILVLGLYVKHAIHSIEEFKREEL